MKEDIKKIIEKNLPAQVSEVLQERLKQADADAISLAHYKIGDTKNKAAIGKLEKQLKEQQALDTDIKVNENLLKDIEKRERNLEISKLKIKLEESEKRADMVQAFTAGLVRNTTFKKTVFDSFQDGQPVIDGQGYTQYPVMSQKNLTETKEKE